jgi:hypothetical protein
MAFKLIEAAQARWRKVNAPESVALVRAGVLFRKGKVSTNVAVPARVHRSATVPRRISV